MKIKSSRNRLANVNNKYQGDAKRVLCVCSAGLLRSPTAALVLSQKPFNYNTRAAGLESEYALIPVDEALVEWAQEIVCMSQDQVDCIMENYDPAVPVYNLDIPDHFSYGDPELMDMIKKSYFAQGKEK